MNVLSIHDDNNKNKNDRIMRGEVVLMKKNVLDFKDLSASFLDGVHELVGKRVSLQLVSADKGDPG